MARNDGAGRGRRRWWAGDGGARGTEQARLKLTLSWLAAHSDLSLR